MNTLIVVSGGDAPGINTAVAAFVQQSRQSGDQAFGAIGGFPAVLSGRIIPLSAEQLLPFAAHPGSFLVSSREAVLGEPGADARLHSVLSEHQIDNVLLFGGNGTLHYVLPLLVKWGIRCVGIPTTIDNDVPGTDYTLGFDSACNYAYQAVDGALATALALPGRIFLLETLGGNTGYLALEIARGAGAHGVLLPEYAYEDGWLIERIQKNLTGEGFSLVVLSEGVRAARTLADDIPKWTGVRVRDIRLGHAQRGGNPTHRDRVFAREAALLAYQALRNGINAGVIVQQGGQVHLHSGTLESSTRPAPDYALYTTINGL